MTLADVSSRLSDISERYRVPERVSAASQKISEGMSAAGDAACKSAEAAYRFARANPRTSIGAVIMAAALVGGALWWVFAHERKPLQRRRKVERVHAGSERRKRTKHARAAAA